MDLNLTINAILENYAAEMDPAKIARLSFFFGLDRDEDDLSEGEIGDHTLILS